jgi:hypothetical protein
MTRHLLPLSMAPALAEDIAPEVKLTFIRNVLNVGLDHDLIEDSLLRDLINVSIPLFINKNPQNP